MDIIKKNIVSIILGVIALVALSTPLWLLPSYTESLEGKAKASQATAGSITGLLNKERMKPGVGADGQPERLDRFPNDETIAEGEALQKKVAATASDMLAAAVAINQQSMTLPGLTGVLLVPDSLPSPKNQAAFDFRDRYTTLTRENALATQILGAGMPPSKEEVDSAIATLKQQVERKFRTLPGGGDNRAELEIEFKAQSMLVAERLMNKRAGEIKMYVDPGAFTWHPAFAQIGGQAPNRVQMWQAQMGLWIQTSFAKALAIANKDAVSVRDALVKRLVRIDFLENPYVLAAPAAGATGGSRGPMVGGTPAVIPTEDLPVSAPLAKDYAKSLTGRVSNQMYDVVHFRAVLHVDHTRVPELLATLDNGRFMYIRSMHIEAIDSAGLLLQGYVYGPAPVVQLSLEMEMLFMRSWTSQYMPDPVRVVLGIAPRDPTAFARPGGEGMGGPDGGPPSGY